MIDKFDGEFSFLSNFYESPVKYRGHIFGSAEAAFQAQKCQDTSLIKSFCGLSPSESKRKGRHVTLRKDWFSQNETFWGVCNGVGENKLGHILMEVREKLSQSS